MCRYAVVRRLARAGAAWVSNAEPKRPNREPVPKIARPVPYTPVWLKMNDTAFLSTGGDLRVIDGWLLLL